MSGRAPSGPLALELEYFEQVQVTDSVLLLRVGGRWVGEPAGELTAPELLVESDGDTRRLAALPASGPVPRPGSGPSTWRAAFSAQGLELGGGEGRWRLDVGEVVDLPAPASRTSRGEPPPPVAVPAGNGAEPPRDVEEPPAAAEEPPAAAEEPPAAAPPASAHEVPALVPDPRPARPPRRDLDEEGEEPDHDAPRGRRRLLVGLVLLAIAAVCGVAAAAISLSDGDDPPQAAAPSAPAQSAQPAPADDPPASEPIELEPLAGGDPAIAGSVTPLAGGVVELRVGGLEDAPYEAWLYDDILSATSVARFRGPEAKLRFRLPEDAAQSKFLDISREGDDAPGHSGRSVLRVPLSALGAG